MEHTSYRQLRAYAAQYGAVVGAMWIVSFAFYIVGLSSPALVNLSLITGILSVVAAGYLVRKFRQEVAPLRFAQAWWMGIMMYTYASLLMAAAQYIYFRYIDDGFLVATYTSVMQQPEAVAMMERLLPNGNAAQATEATADLLRSITPIQFTINFLVYNLLGGFLLAIPTAWIGLAGKKRAPEQN